VGLPSLASSEVGVTVSEAILLVFVFAAACGVALMLSRILSARAEQARAARLKAHLDWVNPTPQTTRKRRLSR
jgi:hypothetical protein